MSVQRVVLCGSAVAMLLLGSCSVDQCDWGGICVDGNDIPPRASIGWVNPCDTWVTVRVTHADGDLKGQTVADGGVPPWGDFQAGVLPGHGYVFSVWQMDYREVRQDISEGGVWKPNPPPESCGSRGWSHRQ